MVEKEPDEPPLIQEESGKLNEVFLDPSKEMEIELKEDNAGFIKTIRRNLGVDKIVRMHFGFTLVNKDLILEIGVIHFDKKPMALRLWSSDMDTKQMVRVLVDVEVSDSPPKSIAYEIGAGHQVAGSTLTDGKEKQPSTCASENVEGSNNDR
uniref:Uncharacterized protein n=1 Tax=Cannabis sativa TaxID=3483 RepID=A0A803PKI1_CANSA